MSSLEKGCSLIAVFVLGVIAFLVVLSMLPDPPHPSDAQVKAHSRTTESIEASCGRPDRSFTEYGLLGGVLTYAYDKKGAYVHFMLLEGKPPIAVTVSRGNKTYRIEAPEVGSILPCALRW